MQITRPPIPPHCCFSGGRKEVSGGNWTVSFEEELYLGFSVQTMKDGKPSQQLYWSAKPSRSHKFHYDRNRHEPFTRSTKI